MASRENQGLQAALIVFVLITIALSVTTYIYFRKAEEHAAEADAAYKQVQQANAARDGALSENQKLKEMLGYDISEKLAVIEKQFQEDMALFGADYPDSDPKNYRTLPNYMLAAALAKHTGVVEAEAREQKALAEKQATEQRVTAEKEAAEASRDQLVALYESERNNFNTERGRINNEKTQLANTLRTKDQEITAVKTAGQQAVERYTAQIAELEKVLETLRNQKREREQTTFETANGRITFVNQRERTVWINVGMADGLQRHTTFSVYDENVHEYSPQQVKGEIEVTKLLDRHLAEARIINDSHSNPIVQGDLIYTPAWRPGVFLHFAVAGFIDINGDGVEDKELLRNIIHANGGVIDAEVDARGNVVGQMTVNTRYLILGERPDEKTGAQDPAALAAFSTMYQNATRLGVELMPLPRFLSLMGYKAGVKTVQLGGRAGQSPAAAARPSGQAPAATAPAPPAAGADDAFRPRRPPRGGAGAF